MILKSTGKGGGEGEGGHDASDKGHFTLDKLNAANGIWVCR